MEHPIGTGPYKFVSWDKDVAVKLIRNDQYWGAAPAIKNVVIQIIPDNSARASAMMAGEIDAMAQVDPASIAALKEKNIPLYEAPGMNINYMAFDVTRPPFDEPKLREAIIRAINVPELVQQLYLGYSIPAYSVLPSFVPGYAAGVKNFEYDVEKAQSLLKECGAENLSIKMIAYSNPRPYNTATGVKLAEAIQGYLSKVGVTVDITQYDWTTYKQMATQGEGDIKFYGWTGDNGDADNFMNLLSDQNRSMNVSGYNNPEYKALIDKAASTPNGPERNALYADMEAIVARDAVWLPISHSIVNVPYAADVVNFSQHPTGSTYFKFVSKK
jgi:peptide/nickel transport system substrate-binding protein